MNPLQELVAAHCRNHGENLADVAARGGMSRQTLSALMHNHDIALPRTATLDRLAVGLRLPPRIVRLVAAASASGLFE